MLETGRLLTRRFVEGHITGSGDEVMINNTATTPAAIAAGTAGTAPAPAPAPPIRLST